MKNHPFALGVAAAAFLAVGACSQNENENGAAGEASAQSPEAKQAAGEKTIAAGLASNSKFVSAAKAAGLDQTLAGPGPYTVFVPDDAAFNGASAQTFDPKPENRARITGALTNLILPGTVLAEDIGKAIDNGQGKAMLATMGGGTLTATREGGRIVLTDQAGQKATINRADQRFSNGVVHHVDALLLPGSARQPSNS